jgi:hypothetical protein
MFDYAGCLHFHSAYSYDAAQSVDAIVSAGLDAGLDFALLTDHFSLDARKDGWERWHGSGERKMLLLVGEEISPRYNHYLALNLREPLIFSKGEAHSQDMIDAVTAQGGFGFIAHPDHAGAPFVGVRAFPWIDWTASGFAGISIWDLMGDWVSAMTNPWRVLRGAFAPSGMLRGPREETLNRWDELSQRGHIVAIGEVDNHATPKRLWGLRRTIFPFSYAFRTIRTHVLLPAPLSGELDKDRATIYQALRDGQSYVSLDRWNNPRGFHFEIFDANRRVAMGAEIVRQGPLLADIKTPAPGGAIRLIRNGRVIREERGRSYMERDIDLPGVYRVEVRQKIGGRWRPWIYSNPIWVR